MRTFTVQTQESADATVAVAAVAAAVAANEVVEVSHQIPSVVRKTLLEKLLKHRGRRSGLKYEDSHRMGWRSLGRLDYILPPPLMCFDLFCFMRLN